MAPQPRRVAVIAVHGVADQRPDESNMAVANLLGEHQRDGVRYSGFQRSDIQIAQAPVGPPQVDRMRGSGRSHTVRAGETREYLDRVPADDRDWEVSYQFMHMQLDRYAPTVNRGAYETSVRRGTRTQTDESGRVIDQSEVDVYEMYWADLSRLATGPFAFFGSLYQLLLHLATLGRQAVDDAAAENPRLIWRLLAHVQHWAVLMLTLPIPMLNVVLLIVGLTMVPVAAAHDRSCAPAVAAGLLIGITFSISLYALVRGRPPKTPRRWTTLLLLTLVAAAAVSVALTSFVAPSDDLWVAAAWWAFGAVALYRISRAYQQMRPHAVLFAMSAYVLAAVSFLHLLGAAANGDVEQATFFTLQWIFAALRISWGVLVLFAMALIVFWPIAWLTTRADADAWSRGRAALRTGRLTLSLSTGAFLIVTVVVWSSIFPFAVSKLGAFNHFTPRTAPTPAIQLLLPSEAVLADLDRRTAVVGDTSDINHFTAPEYFQGLIASSVTGAAPLSSAVTALAFLLLVWMAIPSIRAEADAPSTCTNAQARAGGRWLSRGLDSTRFVAYLFLIAALFLPTAGRLFWGQGALMEMTYRMVGMVAAFVGASALAVAGIVVANGGSVLDVLLDVDNYLRTTPIESTPRARICERYASLLRHVCNPPDDREYEQVIVVAHSLGALISAEFLYYLATEARRGHGDERLGALGYSSGARPSVPLTLFTMGNPLRQLLNRFFPHRYRWVRSAPDNGTRPLADSSALEPQTVDASRPSPARLGIARWENAYRSGDYVGRAIWHEEWYQRDAGVDTGGGYPSPLLVSSANRPDIAEYCIGAGGHTHYWDRSAPDIADRLDTLIATVPPLLTS